MWIVQLALRRPYTFIVAALLLLIVSPLVILRTLTAIVRTLTSPSLASCGNTAKASPGAPYGQAEANLWSFHGRFQNGFECLRETLFRRFAQSGKVSPHVKLILNALRK